MRMFIDAKGVPTRVGDRVSVPYKGSVGIVEGITPTGVNIILDGAEFPERFMHESVCRLIQKADTLGIAIELVNGLVDSLTTLMGAEEDKEADTDERSQYYTYGKQWAFRRARSFALSTLRGLERLEAGQDF